MSQEEAPKRIHTINEISNFLQEVLPTEQYHLVESVIGQLNKENIVGSLHTLARIGGEELLPDHPGRFEVKRLALTEIATKGRDHLRTEMSAIAERPDLVENYPLADVLTIEGEDPELPAIVMGSHIDTVPSAGAYDGTAGVITGLEIAKILRRLQEQGTRLKRSVKVVGFDIEESSRFKTSLLGSKAMFKGLTDEELDTINDGKVSLRTALEEAGYFEEDIAKLHAPIFTKENTAVYTESHISQQQQQESKIAMVEAIAAPDRDEITVGKESLKRVDQLNEKAQYVEFTIEGKAGHSGATPMGPKSRADGLVEAAHIVKEITDLQKSLNEKGSNTQLNIGGIFIEEGAINKIPGKTKIIVRISGGSAQTRAKFPDMFYRLATNRNAILSTYNAFDKDPVTTKQLHTRKDSVVQYNSQGTFFDPKEMMPRYEAAAHMIIAAAEGVDNESQVVRTVGTFNVTNEGKIVMQRDVRSIDETERDAAVTQLNKIKDILARRTNQHIELTKLSKSSPAKLNEKLVQLGRYLFRRFNLAEEKDCSTEISAAGHDTQNAVYAGIPSIMWFAPSEKGLSHHKLEYTEPEDFERMAKAQAAMVVTLANYVGDMDELLAA